MKNDKRKFSFYVVITFIIIFVIITLTDIFYVDGSNSYDTTRYDDDAEVLETAPPFGVQLSSGTLDSKVVSTDELYSGNYHLYSSTLDSKVVSTAYKFADKLLARQVEMQQLILNISASMSKNPLVQQIQASRAQFRYPAVPSMNIDTTLQLHRGHDATWQPVAGTRHKFYVYSAFYDDREKHVVRVIAATKTKKSDKVRNY